MKKIKLDSYGYYNADSDAPDADNEVNPDANPSDESLGATTPNQGFELAKKQGFKGAFQDFLNFYNKAKENPTVASGISKVKSLLGQLIGNKTNLTQTPTQPSGLGNNAPPQANTILGMPAPVGIAVVVLSIGLISFGVYKLTAKKA